MRPTRQTQPATEVPMSRTKLLALGALALITACAAPQVRLKPEARAEIDTLDSVLIVPRSTPGADTGRADPILDTLRDYDLRAALRDALEQTKDMPATQGVYNMTAADHSGFDERGRELIAVKDGKWTLIQ